MPSPAATAETRSRTAAGSPLVATSVLATTSSHRCRRRRMTRPARGGYRLNRRPRNVPRARCHDGRRRHPDVSPAWLSARRRRRRRAGRGCVVRRLFRGAADPEPVPAPARGRRAQFRLCADVVAHQGRKRRRRDTAIRRGGAQRNGVMVASSSQAAVSWLYYANRLYELPLGVVSIAIASVLGPAIAASVRSDDGAHAASVQSRALEIALGLSLPAAVAFAVLSEAIAGGLFQRGAFGPRDTAMVAAAMAAISAGLPGHSLEKVMGAVSFAHEDTHTPMYTALCGLATAVTGALILFPRYGHVGIAAAIALSGWVGATLLAAILWRRGWLRIEAEAWRRVPRIVLATLVMGAFIAGADALLASWLNISGSSFARVAALGLMVAAGLGLYVGCLQALGVASVRILLRAIRERF